MQKILFFVVALFLTAVSRILAQCPGPENRTALINLQKANIVESSRAGQIPLTDACGNLRYAQFVEIDLVPITYTPSSTGNTQNYSEFVTTTGGDIWFIDWQGRGIKLYTAGGSTGDKDWLEIDNNLPPDNIRDSMYTYSFTSIGARYVWPGANFVVNDSINSADQIIQGNRDARIGLYNSLNGAWSSYAQTGGEANTYLGGGTTSWSVAAATGTPVAPGTPVKHFSVITSDSTIRAQFYPSSRRDSVPVENFLFTDPDGVVQSQGLSSLPGAAYVYSSALCASPIITPDDQLGPFIAWNQDCEEQWTWNGSAWVLSGSPSGSFFTSSEFTGDGDISTPLTLAQQGADDGDVLTWDDGAGRFIPLPGGGGGVAEPENQIVFGTGLGINSSDSLKYVNDTLLIKQGRIKIKSTLEDSKIIIDNRKPFTYTSGTVTVSDKIMEVFPPINRNVSAADTTPAFYMWNDYTKYQSGQTGDNVFGMGMNLRNGNGRAVSGFAAVGLSLENWFQPNVGGNGLTEFITHWIPKNSTIRRPFAWYGDNTANTINTIFNADIYSVVNNTTGVEVFNNTGGTFIYKGNASTGASARPEIRLADQRNTSKYSSFSADTTGMGVSGYKFLTFGLSDATGWIQIQNRLADTKLLFGQTISNTTGRPFFETKDDGNGYYKSGGTILLNNYSCIGTPINNGYGGVGSNYYLDNAGVLKYATGDVSNGIYFENNAWKFWNAPSGSANGAITMTTRATLNSTGSLALGTTANPAYTLDAPTTAAIRIPSGTTAQAPTGAVGVMRVNTTTSKAQVVRTGTAYEDILTLQDALSATSGQVLTWSGSIWAPSTPATITNIYNSNGTFGSFRTGTITDQLTFSKTTDALGGLVPFRLSVGGNDADFQSYVSPANNDSLHIRRIDGKGYGLLSPINIIVQNTTENVGLEIDATTETTIVSGAIATNSSTQQDVTTTPVNITNGIHTVVLQPGAGTITLPEIGNAAGQARQGTMLWVTNFSGGTVTINAFSGDQIQQTTSVTIADTKSAWVKSVSAGDWAMITSN